MPWNTYIGFNKYLIFAHIVGILLFVKILSLQRVKCVYFEGVVKMKYDVVVIGAGVVGSLITRELSKYNLKVALLERANDCAMGATKANSAIVHAGFDAKPGSLKAKLNVRGVELMKTTCKELNVPLKNIGAFVVAFFSSFSSTPKNFKPVCTLVYFSVVVIFLRLRLRVAIVTPLSNVSRETF